MKLSFSCSWRTKKTAAEYPRCIRPAGSSCTSAEASTTHEVRPFRPPGHRRWY